VCEWRGTHLGLCLGISKSGKGARGGSVDMGNDSARDPKRTKRADVLDEVEPRLCWGRSSDSRRVGGHDVGGFVKP
jgi:hypothetical protein